jgi:hypothetical protein
VVAEVVLIYSLSPKRLPCQEESRGSKPHYEHILITPGGQRHQGKNLETSTGFYDGGYVLDPIKQLPNDIGRFLHVVADLGILSNAYASNYVQNLANLAAGFYSAIDPKSAIWNKGLNVTQVPGLVYTPTQMNALTFAKFNVLRYKGANTAPVLLHDRTAAIFNSDFTFLLRMNIHGLVIDTLNARADQYEGQSSLDGLQMTSMKSALDEDMVTLQKRGYLSGANINIATTQAQQNRPSVLRQHRLGLFLLWCSQRLARGRQPAGVTLRPITQTSPTRPLASSAKAEAPCTGADDRRVWLERRDGDDGDKNSDGMDGVVDVFCSSPAASFRLRRPWPAHYQRDQDRRV